MRQARHRRITPHRASKDKKRALWPRSARWFPKRPIHLRQSLSLSRRGNAVRRPPRRPRMAPQSPSKGSLPPAKRATRPRARLRPNLPWLIMPARMRRSIRMRPPLPLQTLLRTSRRAASRPISSPPPLPKASPPTRPTPLPSPSAPGHAHAPRQRKRLPRLKPRPRRVARRRTVPHRPMQRALTLHEPMLRTSILHKPTHLQRPTPHPPQQPSPRLSSIQTSRSRPPRPPHQLIPHPPRLYLPKQRPPLTMAVQTTPHPPNRAHAARARARRPAPTYKRSPNSKQPL